MRVNLSVGASTALPALLLRSGQRRDPRPFRVCSNPFEIVQLYLITNHLAFTYYFILYSHRCISRDENWAAILNVTVVVGRYCVRLGCNNNTRWDCPILLCVEHLFIIYFFILVIYNSNRYLTFSCFIRLFFMLIASVLLLFIEIVVLVIC